MFRRVAVLFFLWLVLWFLLSRLFAVGVSSDSLHYMSLSIRPLVGDSHPLFFPAILAALRRMALTVPWLSFESLFLGFQALCLVVPGLVWVMTPPPSQKPWGQPQWRRWGALIFLVIVIPVTVVGSFLYANNVMSEFTALALIVVLALVVDRLCRSWQWGFAMLAIVLTVVGFHTRFELALLPIACLAAAWRFSRHFPPREKRLMKLRWVVITVGMALGILGSGRGLTFFVDKTDNFRPTYLYMLSASVQSALRCNVTMYSDVDCSTQQGKVLIESTAYPTMFEGSSFGGAFFRKMRLGTRSAWGLPSLLGWKGMAEWVIQGPILFYRTAWNMDLGEPGFFFNNAGKYFPYAEAGYSSLLNKDPQITTFSSKAIQWLRYCYYDLKLFHRLGLVAVVFCGIILFTSRSPMAVFFAAYVILTVLLLSYFNPASVFRYLLKLLIAAALSAFAFRREPSVR